MLENGIIVIYLKLNVYPIRKIISIDIILSVSGYSLFIFNNSNVTFIFNHSTLSPRKDYIKLTIIALIRNIRI